MTNEETINVAGPIEAGTYPLSIAYGHVSALKDPDLRLDVAIRRTDDAGDILRVTERSEVVKLHLPIGMPETAPAAESTSTPESHAKRIEDLRAAGHLSSVAHADPLDEEPMAAPAPAREAPPTGPTRYVVRWHVRPQVPVTVTIGFPTGAVELRSKPQR